MDRLLQFFEYKHLPDDLQRVSLNFYHIAHWMYESLPSNAESTVAMRKLLEAKDCAVRSVVYKEDKVNG